MYAAKHNSNRTNRKLTFQTLESRQLMAGNVAVSVLNGDLKITGDVKDNDVAIVQTMQQGQVVPGSYYISGLNGTTINGASGGAYFTGVNHDFLINLTQGGNDHLAMGTNGGFDPSLTNANFIVPHNLNVSFDVSGDNNQIGTFVEQDSFKGRHYSGGLFGMRGGSDVEKDIRCRNS